MCDDAIARRPRLTIFATTISALAAAIMAGLLTAPGANASGLSCGQISYPNSRQVGVLTVYPGGPSCLDARAVIDNHFAAVLTDDTLPTLPLSSPLRSYDCQTDFTRAGGHHGYTECRYIVGEGNDADNAMEIDILPL